MGSVAVKANIQSAIADGNVTNVEADKILDRTHFWFKKDPSLGKEIGQDEYKSLSALRQQIATGSITAEPGVAVRLDQILATEKPYTPVAHAAKEGAQAAAIMTGFSLLLGGGIGKAVGSGLGWGAAIGLLDYGMSGADND